MMKKSIVALTAFLAASVVINNGAAKADHQLARQEIIQKYHSMSEGCNARAIEQCFAYWSVDFQGRQADGRVIDLTEAIQGAQDLFQQASEYQTREELIRVSVSGNRAEVMGLGYSDYVIGDKRIHRQTPYEDTWELTSNGWVLVSTKWYQPNYNEVAIGRSPSQTNQQLSPEVQQRLADIYRKYTIPVPPPSTINNQFNSVWEMPKFWNP